MERIIETTAGPEAAGMRLDLWLSRRFSYRSRNEWQRTVRSGEIRIDGIAAKSSRVLRGGEVIAFVPAEPVQEPAVDLSYSILHREKDWLVLAKSGNLPCHPSGVFFQNTLWHAVKEREGLDISIITRLDRETSGVVLAATGSEAAGELTGMMMSHRIRKRYLALVYGHMPDRITADGWLSPDTESPVRKKRRFSYQETPGAESASTVLNPLWSDDRFTLVEALPATGRLHQIRATLCSLGYPLAGDKMYGPDSSIYLRFLEDSMTPEDLKQLVLPTQALHAESLSFQFRGKDYEFHAPVPEWGRKTDKT